MMSQQHNDQPEDSQSNDNTRSSRGRSHFLLAAGSGVLVAGLVGVGAWSLGTISGAQASILLESMAPSSRLLSSTIMTVTATILALMLTLLSFGSQLDKRLSLEFYRRIKVVAGFDALTFSFTALLFLLHCVPVYDSQSVPAWWYPAVYYSTLSGAAIATGGAVTIVVLLLLALRELIDLISGDYVDHPLLRSTSEDSES